MYKVTKILNKYFKDISVRGVKLATRAAFAEYENYREKVQKKGEEIIEKATDFLMIKTSYYDKLSFFKKILRYTSGCEIVSPMPLREAFRAYVQELYQMYDCPE